LTNKPDEATKTLTGLISSTVDLELKYPIIFVESIILLVEICKSKCQIFEAGNYLLQAIIPLINMPIRKDYDSSFLYEAVFRLLEPLLHIPVMQLKDYLPINYFFGTYYFKAGDYETAYEGFTKAIKVLEEVRNDDLKTLQELKLHQGQCKIKLEEYQEAFDILKTIPDAGLSPGQLYGPWTHHISAAFCQFKMGNVTEAKRIISRHIISCFVNNDNDYEPIFKSVRKCEQKAYNREESKFFQDMLQKCHLQKRLLQPKDGAPKLYPQFYNSLSITKMIQNQVDIMHLDMVKNVKDCTCYQHML
jgi:tetratricopeptide (TPR) repeat protein